MRPVALKGKALLGFEVKGAWKSGLVVMPAAARAAWRGNLVIRPIGSKIKIAPPNMAAAAKARVAAKLDARGMLVGDVVVIDHRTSTAGAAGTVDVHDRRAGTPPDVNVQVPTVGADVTAKVPTVDVHDRRTKGEATEKPLQMLTAIVHLPIVHEPGMVPEPVRARAG